MICEAEASKARMFTTKVNEPSHFLNCNIDKQVTDFHAMPGVSNVDDNYLVIGGHLDGSIKGKILNNEYIDFAHLIPRDQHHGEDNRMEIINKCGQSFFVPVSDREMTGITSFSNWEQAFRIFSNIYTSSYPERASELIQDNHIIYVPSQTYIWNNVYQYDKEFRTHISHFPQRSWAIILQQAWSIYLKDRIRYDDKNHSSFGASGSNGRHKREACKCFNKGLCTAG